MREDQALDEELAALQSRAIVLRIVPYKDSQELVSFFSEKWGRVSAVFKRSFSKKTAQQRHLVSPLRLVFLTLRKPMDHSFIQIEEISLWGEAFDIPVSRHPMSYFLAELIDKIARAGDGDHDLYEWIHQCITYFYENQPVHPNFHLAFMMGLLRIKGIMPPRQLLQFPPHQDKIYYDLREHRYVSHPPLSEHISDSEAPYIAPIARMHFKNMHKYNLSGKQRRRIIEVICTYYGIHEVELGKFRTLEVFGVTTPQPKSSASSR